MLEPLSRGFGLDSLPGLGQVGYARKLLAALDWWALEPRRGALRVDGKPNPLPTRTDLTPPQAAVIDGKTWVVYVPRGNAGRHVTLRSGPTGLLVARWFDPRQGEFVGSKITFDAATQVLPPRPTPPDEDWVLLLSPDAGQINSGDRL